MTLADREGQPASPRVSVQELAAMTLAQVQGYVAAPPPCEVVGSVVEIVAGLDSLQPHHIELLLFSQLHHHGAVSNVVVARLLSRPEEIVRIYAAGCLGRVDAVTNELIGAVYQRLKVEGASSLASHIVIRLMHALQSRTEARGL